MTRFTHRILGVGLFVLFASVSTAQAQLTSTHLTGDGALNAPYRGPVSAWRDAHLDMSYGEVINYKLFQIVPDSDAEFTGSWNRELIRVFSGWDASGPEVESGDSLLGGIAVTSDGPPYWRLSIKALGTRSATVSAAQAINIAYTELVIPECLDYPGLSCFDAGCCACDEYFETCASWCDPPCGCYGGCNSDPSGVGTSLFFKVAPTAIDPVVSEQHGWYPGTPVLHIRAGAAELVATINESVEMIGQSYLIAPPADTYKQQMSLEVRLPGMPETVMLQRKSFFTAGSGFPKQHIGTPWPGHMPGWWVEGSGTTLDPYDVRGPDGTVYRFSEPSAGTGPTFHLKYIFPPGIDRADTTPNSKVTYTYTTVSTTKYVYRITDDASPANYIQFNRQAGATTKVDTIVTSDGRSWNIDDVGGWISLVDPPGGKGTRSYVHDAVSGRLLDIKNDSNAFLHSYTFNTTGAFVGEISTESTYFTAGTSTPVASYVYNSGCADCRKETLVPGFSSPNRETICTYAGQRISSVSIGGVSTTYEWEETDNGSVALKTLTPTGPNAVPIRRGYGDTGDDKLPFLERVKLNPASNPITIYNVEYEYKVGTNYHRIPKLKFSRDAEGNETALAYYPSVTDYHQLSSVTGPMATTSISPAQAITQYTYYADGNSRDGLLKEVKTKMTSTQWRTTLLEYDTLRRLTKTTIDPFGQNLVTNYQASATDLLRADGQPLLVSDPRNYLTRYTYDTAGRRTQEEQYLQLGASSGAAYTTAYFYSPNGWLERVDRPIRDQDGVDLPTEGIQRVKFTRDTAGRVIRVDTGKASGPSGVDANESVARGYRLNNLGETVKTTDQDGLYEKFVYDNRGLLFTRTPGYGDTIGNGSDGPAYTDMAATYAYDNSDRLGSIQYPNGRQIVYGQRDSFGRPQEITENPNGARTQLTYNRNSQITRRQVFDGATRLSDTSTAYDELQRAYRVVDGSVDPAVSAGSIALTCYRLDGQVDRVLRKGTHPCSGANNGSDNPDSNTSIDPALGDYYVDLLYDTAGRLVQSSEPSDQISCPSPTITPLITTLDLDNGGNALTVDVGGRVTTNVFDALGRLRQTTPPTGARTDTSYNSLSLPLEISKQDTINRQQAFPIAKTRYDYDAVGFLRSATRVDASSPPLPDSTTSFVYHTAGASRGRLHQITDAENRTTTFTYDDALRTRTVTDHAMNVITDKFDTAGRMEQFKVTEPNVGSPGSLTRTVDFNYVDPLGLTTEIRRNNSASSSIIQHRDVRGNITSIEDLRSATHAAELDQAGRVTALTEAQGTLSRETTSAFSRQGIKSVTFDPGAAPSQTTSYLRTPGGQVRNITYPDTGAGGTDSVLRGYNVFGELTSRVDQRGVTIASQIFKSNEHRVTTTVGAGQLEYLFDGAGRLVSAKHTAPSEDTSEVIFQYDGQGRLIEERQTLDGSAYTTKYRYNDAGEVIEVTYPCANPPCANILNLEARGTPLDALGRPKKLDFNGVALCDYDWEGRRVKAVTSYQPGGADPLLKLAVEYDDFARQEQRSWVGWANGALTKPIETTQLHYDAGDYLTHSISSLPGRSLSVVTDALGRVTRLVRGTGDGAAGLQVGSTLVDEDRSQSPGLDLLGNLLRTVQQIARPSGGYQVAQLLVQSINQANEITQFKRITDGVTGPNVNLVYDHAGNLIADGKQYYVYDDVYQLTEVGDQGGAVFNPNGTHTGSTGAVLAKFTYDALGRRLTQEIFPPPASHPPLPDGIEVGTVRYLYSGHRLLEVRDAATGELHKRHFYSPESLDSRIRTDDYAIADPPGSFVSFFYANDRLGSPLAVVTHDTTANQAVVSERYLFDAQGRSFVTPGERTCLLTDVNCDGSVDAIDLVVVRNAFGPSTPGQPANVCGPAGPPDNVVDDKDLACVRADLGKGLDLTALPTASQPTSDRTVGLHGLTYDHATGLIYARARYYHPELGRWTRRDPKGYIDSGSLYEAFGNNPARNQDPMGTDIGAQGEFGEWTNDQTHPRIVIWFDPSWWPFTEEKLMTFAFDVERDRSEDGPSTESWITLGQFQFLVNTQDLRAWVEDGAHEAMQATQWRDSRKPGEKFVAAVLMQSFLDRFGAEWKGVFDLETNKYVVDPWELENIVQNENQLRRGVSRAGAMVEAGMKDVMYGFLFSVGAEVASQGVQIVRTSRAMSGARPPAGPTGAAHPVVQAPNRPTPVVRGSLPKGGSPQRPIVIGENMERVSEYAERIGGDVYSPVKFSPWVEEFELVRNQRWLQDQVRAGRRVIDIGPDFARRRQTGEIRRFYSMERRVLHETGYTNYEKVFIRNGRVGGVRGMDPDVTP